MSHLNKSTNHLGHDYDNNEFYYSNEDNDEVFVNIFDIKSVCNKYQQYFSSKSALHKYLKTECSPPGSCQLTKLSSIKQQSLPLLPVI